MEGAPRIWKNDLLADWFHCLLVCCLVAWLPYWLAWLVVVGFVLPFLPFSIASLLVLLFATPQFHLEHPPDILLPSEPSLTRSLCWNLLKTCYWTWSRTWSWTCQNFSGFFRTRFRTYVMLMLRKKCTLPLEFSIQRGSKCKIPTWFLDFSKIL